MPITFTPAKTMPARPTTVGQTGHLLIHQGLHDAVDEVRTSLTSIAAALDGKQWIGTQAQYDALGSYSASTIYMVTG